MTTNYSIWSCGKKKRQGGGGVEENDNSAKKKINSRHITRKPTAGFVNVLFGMIIPSG